MKGLEQIHKVSVPNTDCKGVIFAVTAVPTQGENGAEGIGGIGETWFVDTLGFILHRSVLGFGKAFRELATNKTGRPLMEDEFEAWRANLAATGSVDQEHEVDSTLWNMAQHEATSSECAVIAGKAVAFLKDRYLLSTDISVVSIGVTVNDAVATYRTWKRQNPESKNPSDDELVATARSRYNRREVEKANFSNAYPEQIPDYSRDSTLNNVNYLFDNTPERTEEEMLIVVRTFLGELSQDCSVIAPTLVRVMAEPVTSLDK